MNKLLAALICTISLCGSANAEIVKFEYTGRVTSATTDRPEGYLSNKALIDGYTITYGNTVKGTVTYDTATPWSNTLYGLDFYRGFGEITATVMENGFAIATTPAEEHQLGVGNDSSMWSQNSDAFWLTAISRYDSGDFKRFVSFVAFDHTHTVFDGTELPKHLDLGDFQDVRLTVDYINGQYWTLFSVDIDSLELVREVPEPASGALLFTGLGLLLGARRFSPRKL